MTITNKKKTLLAVCLTIAVVVAIAGGFAVEKLLHIDTYKESIVQAVQEKLNRKVQYSKGEFSLRFGPALTFRDVVIMERDGQTPFLTAERLTFKIALLPLLKRKVALTALRLEQPTIQLVREKTGEFNISDLLESKKEEPALPVTGLRMKKGKINFTDRFSAQTEQKFSLDNTNISVKRFVRGKRCAFKISTQLAEDGYKSTLSVGGSATLSPVDKPLINTLIDARVVANNINAGRFWQYYQRYVPFQKITGQLSINSDFKGTLTSFTSKGEMRTGNLNFNYPQVFHAVLTPKDLHFKYDMELGSKDIKVKSLDLYVDGFQVKGSCALLDIPSGDLRITAHATTSTFDLEKFHQYIPYGIIVDDTAEFIEKHIKGGIYRLDEGILDGRISQIAHMEKGDNYNVLYIRGRVEKGLLTFGPDVPTFNGIKGELEMRGKDFNLNGMAGNFGSSPFTLNGKITDYPLDKPSGYPFNMVMTPRQPEAEWLFDGKKSGKLLLTGQSTLRLSGEGFTSGYNLSGDWNLLHAAVSYPDLITKPVDRPAQLIFKGSINKQEAKLHSMQLSLPPLALNASADYRFAGKRRFSCDIRTNQFPMGELAPLLPKLAKYQPSGRIKGTIHGSSRQEDVKNIRWSGNASFAGASLKPAENFGTLSNITGTVHFSDNFLETSQLSIRLGSSSITGKGTVVNFADPAFNIDFSSPALFLGDLGLRTSANKDIKIIRASGSASLKNNNLQVRHLAGQVNNSSFTVKGGVQDLHNNPKADISVTASHLELEDILALTELEPVNNSQSHPPSTLTVKATVSADSGKARDYLFEKLHTSVAYENKILYLHSLGCIAYGGRVNGKGRFDFGSNGIPRYQVNYNLERLSAEQLTKALGIKTQEITGTLSLSGDLTAKGNNLPDFKRTALGSARLRIDQGTMRRFPALSKVFSILNISQLLKFQLPDMVSGGMPYNKITATLAVKDGIVSTQDLFVDSNAINISAVGKLDMVRNELDATIGVQPLQTVDKLVSSIPIVNWVLTGKDKTLITAYFEAKGKLEDPVVKAIPVKSMTKGVFNIFKRLFQLPTKLITDPGEVVIGK